MRRLLIVPIVMLINTVYGGTNMPHTTIVAFGDSTTAPRGTLVVYATLLEQRLAQEGIAGRVINAGAGGQTTAMGRSRFERDVLDHKPRIVIIQFGINDAAVDVWAKPPKTEPRLAIGKYEANLRFFIASIRGQGGDVILMTPNPIFWTPAIRERYGKPPYEPDAPEGFNVLLKNYTAIVRKVAADTKTQLVDVDQAYRTYLAEPGHQPKDWLLDGMHPNTKGQQQVADMLWPVAANILKTVVSVHGTLKLETGN